MGDNGIPFLALFLLLAAIGFAGIRWLQNQDFLTQLLAGAAATSIGIAFLSGVVYYVRNRGKKKRDYVNPTTVQARIDNLAYLMEIRIILFEAHPDIEEGAISSRSESLIKAVVQAFKHFDHPEGSRLLATEIRPYKERGAFFEYENPAQPVRRFPFKSKETEPTSIIGIHEVASMWHMPTREDASVVIQKSYARDIAPPPGMSSSGAHVGDSTIGPPRRILFSEDILKGHELIVARTRMGKSTLIRHGLEFKIQQKAKGLDTDAIVVVDPHSDLVNSLLELIPPELDKKVWLIDLSDSAHVPGINILDAHIFPDRDHTCDGVVRVAKGIWENWRSRMQNILEYTVKSCTKRILILSRRGTSSTHSSTASEC